MSVAGKEPRTIRGSSGARTATPKNISPPRRDSCAIPGHTTAGSTGNVHPVGSRNSKSVGVAVTVSVFDRAVSPFVASRFPVRCFHYQFAAVWQRRRVGAQISDAVNVRRARADVRGTPSKATYVHLPGHRRNAARAREGKKGSGVRPKPQEIRHMS